MRQPSTILSVAADGNTVRLCADDGSIEVTAYRPNVWHIVYRPDGLTGNLPMWGISGTPDPSDPPRMIVSETAASVATDAGEVRIARSDGALDVVDRHGVIVLSSRGYGLEPTNVCGEATFRVRASFLAPDDESYYGLGQHQTNWMDHRGHEVLLSHDYSAKDGEIVAMPFMVTNRGYALVFDNPSRTTVTPGKHGLTCWESEVGEAVSFFVILGDTVDALYGGYRFLTGVTPLPPKVGLGYIQCKQRYKTHDELMIVARTYREKGYPCDVLVVDWFHWKVLGDMDLDPDPWPDPAAMNRELAELGFKVMISCWPRFMKESRYYEELERRGWFMKDSDGRGLYGTEEDPRGALIDTTNPDAAEWYWTTVRENYAAKGFTSWWLDEDEPDICPHGYQLHAGSGARVHNIYPLCHTSAVYEGHRRDLGERCLILSRSAYLGAQRNGTTFWSSDIFPSWETLKRQIPAGLNVCASGLAYWSSDIGGWQELPEQRHRDESFEYESLLIKTEHEHDAPRTMAEYPELYVRWFQFGAFCPTFRAHGTRDENEVWSYGADAELILVKYLKLRYRLMPYIYSLAFEVHRTGAPFMRALFMDFPNDANVRDIKDQYMFGPAFLVAPVVEQGAAARTVYLPAGTGWYDYWTHAYHDGGQTLRVSAPLDTLPLFVREGSIVPHGEVVSNLQIPQREIELWVYEGADGRFTLYDDDGMTYAYEQGACALTELRWDDRAGGMDVDGDESGRFDGPPTSWLRRVSRC